MSFSHECYDTSAYQKLAARRLAHLEKGNVAARPSLLSTVLSNVEKPELVISTIVDYRQLHWGPLFRAGLLDEIDHEDRRRDYPSERDAMESRREPLPFRGDEDSDLDDLCPPLAWVVAWKGKYVNQTGVFCARSLATMGLGDVG